MFHKVGRSTATTLSAPGYTTGDTSINVGSTTNWPSDTGVTFAIDEVDSAGERIAGTYNVFRGDVAGGTQINELVYLGGDANRNYSAGATTRVYILVSSYRDNRFVDGILVEHNQDGTHGAITSTSATLTTPKVITGINDTNGNELLNVTATSSAVNELTLANAATGNAPVLSATGSDTNIGITLTPKGSGKVTIADSTNIGGAWQSWTPTWVNATVGNGTVTAKYIQIGKTVHIYLRFVFGSTSSFSGLPTFTVPVASNTDTWPGGVWAYGIYDDAAVNSYIGVSDFSSATVARLVIADAASTYQRLFGVSATVPFTWGTGDSVTLRGTYQAA